MKGIARKYVEFLRLPDVAPLLGVALVARMPIGMVGFAMLMFLREATGNFALAGSAVGLGFIAMACAAPVQGRLIDLHGPRRLLYVTAVAHPLMLIGILVSAKLGMGYAAIATFSALSGTFASPITTLTRALWRHRFDSEEDRRTAFAIDSVTIEINFTVGPVIVAAALAVVGATAAFALSIGVVVLAAVTYLASRATRMFRKVEAGERHLLGPLTEPRLWIVFFATFGTTVAFGVLEVGYPAFGTARAMPALAGILLAINALGSALGGALYGGLHFRAPVERQYSAILFLMAVPIFLHTTLQTPFAFAVLAFVSGALIAPSIAAQSVLVSRLAPAKYATEAFTWSSTFIVSGLGTGMAVCGMMVETVGLSEAFAVGGLVVTVAALLSLLLMGPARSAVRG